MNGPETLPVDPSPLLPERIGRYRVAGIVGQGGFGIVYRAYDEHLQRLVAIKAPHRKLVATAEDTEAYLTEARTLAKLQHPNIVPVYDVGATDECPCFIVSRFIEGGTLEQRIAAGTTTYTQTAELLAGVAEALRYAHRAGFVHRDLKPGNILLDQTGQPFVVDFGVALKPENVGRGPRHAGTPLYMSPEQARGEGHRVDGRSDIFSLGVVFYELLTGKRPFHAGTLNELLEQITTLEPRPPRQHDHRIPKELERICLKMLAKRATERYTTAMDLGDDLRCWLGTLGERPATEAGPASVAPEMPAAPLFGKDAFVSYASADKEAAFRYCRLLEQQGIGCWIAPRDVPAGADYGAAIIRAIETTAASVLLLSAQANASIHVTHEVERATSKRKRVIPVCLEDVLPGPALELHLATAHRVDAWRLTAEQVVSQVAAAVRGARPLAATPHSDNRPIKIVPKGLRSFDAHDADFFLELLPGPRDRDGLPDSLRFWKTRVEEMDADNAFAVGLIYGPSGCGKSSLMKAGLLPRLAASIRAVYVEATGGETEMRLLNGLRKRCPHLPATGALKDAIAALRLGQGLPAGQKVLIVLDQFEQWLHARRKEQHTELVEALRQCDGVRVQCIVMVRDDFWMAATRFMRDLEIRLLEGQNSAAVDLFDADHARRVLAAFGRAFGKSPKQAGSVDKPEKDFLDQAVASLAQDGKVISVRLALFAEMMKGKPWTPASLQAAGGAAGVGAAFLEETFSATNAPPEHRYHQKAARAVLRALLPEAGADIKGHMRSRQELLQASGCHHRPRDFDDLLRILDSEVRLITPTDPEGAASDEPDNARLAAPRRVSGAEREPSAAHEPSTGRETSLSSCYQLTHDYLVPSLRDWLTRKQKETRRGRAELLLADRAAVWNSRPENRQLPSLPQLCSIRLLTKKRNWTPPERKMLRNATRFHMLRGMALALLLGVAAITGLVIRDQVAEQQRAHQATQRAIREQAEEQQKATHAAGLVQAVLNADTPQAPAIIGAMVDYRQWADPLLREEFAKAAANSRQQLHASLALLSADPRQNEYLYERLLKADPPQVPIVREALRPHRHAFLEKLWAVAEQPARGQETQRLRAAAALASYDPKNKRWAPIARAVAEDLVSVNPVFLGAWKEACRDVGDRLLEPLARVFRDRRPERSLERSLAADLLADYAANYPKVLADLAMDADDKQFPLVLPRLLAHDSSGSTLLAAELDKKTPAATLETALALVSPLLPMTVDARDGLAKRQANAAVALLRMDEAGNAWPMLMYHPVLNDNPSADPRGRSYLIHRFGPLGADVKTLVEQLVAQKDVSIQRALILSIGEMKVNRLVAGERTALIDQLKAMYEKAEDPGLHAAAEWTLGELKEDDWLRQTNEVWTADKDWREQRRARIERQMATRGASAPGAVPLDWARWYVTGQKAKDGKQTVGHTMVVIPGPVVFDMGSPLTEARRRDNEILHKKKIDRTFAIAAKPVTCSQYLRFDESYVKELEEPYTPSLECPVNYVSWTMAAKYCNWLSRQEGLEECYEPGATKLKENYLRLTGYRLPTEAEWEYACRAGAITSRYFGDTHELLAEYARYLHNSDEHSWPVGKRKPNDFGLFDMDGNIWNWCQGRYDNYPTPQAVPIDDKEDDILTIDTSKSRVLRGGSFIDRPLSVRSSFRSFDQADNRGSDVGFRPARTLTAE